MNRLLTLFAVVVFSTTLFCQAFDWEWQNSKPHSNELRAIKIIAPNTIVGFAAAGTVQKSTDNGATWSVKYVDPSGRAFRSADFVDANVGYACGEGGLLMKTIDGGNSFNLLTSGTTNQLSDIDFVDADTGYIGGTSGLLLKTTDGGATWTTITTTGITTEIKAVAAQIANCIYIGSGSTPSSIKKSTDYGVSWQDVSPAGWVNTKSIWDICFINVNIGWFVVQDLAKIYRTTDGGVNWSWTQLPNTIAVPNTIIFKDAITGYVTNNNNPTVSISVDSGKTWTDITAGGTEQFYSVDFSGSTVLAAGRAGSMYKSTDGGLNYSPAFISATTAQIRKISFLNEDFGLCSGGTTTGTTIGFVLKTTDGGDTWNNIGYNFVSEVFSFAHPSSTVWYMARAGNALFKTSDAGANFTQQTSPLTGTSNFNDIGFADTDNGYAFSAGGGVAKTTNGGANWTSANSPFGTTVVWSGSVFNKDTVIAVGASAKAYITTNGGANWNPLSPGIPGSYFVVKFYDEYFGVIAGFNSPNPVAAKTTDGGATWTALSFPTPSAFDGTSLWGIGFKNQDVFWVTGINGVVGYTTDGGTTWTVAKKVTNNAIYSAPILGNDMWLCGDRGTILKGYSDPTIQEIKKVNLTALIEGFYDGSSMVSDTVTVELHDANSPYGVVETAQAVLNSNGQGTTTFVKYAESSTPYYIVIKHRNAVETWSKDPQQFTGGSLNYDFTTASNKAYSDGVSANLPMKQINSKWCFWSGEVTNNYFIEYDDLLQVYNFYLLALEDPGYYPEDITGNEYVEYDDVLLVYNNYSAEIWSQNPLNEVLTARPIKVKEINNRINTQE